jgi:hypothetical protein
LVIVSWRGCQALTLGRGKENREGEQKNKREREGEHECHPNGFPRVGIPGLGCRQQRMLNQLARNPCAKWWVPHTGVGGMPGGAPATSETREREGTGSPEGG